MTKQEFLALSNVLDDDLYELAYRAELVEDDDELQELGKTLVVAVDEFAFYLESILHDVS